MVDRGGHPQVVLRDVLAMDLTLEMSRKKAYTAMSFNAPTSRLEVRAESPLANHDTLMFSGGGVPVTAAGSIVGGIGVSGAPSGEMDEICAQAGLMLSPRIWNGAPCERRLPFIHGWQQKNSTKKNQEKTYETSIAKNRTVARIRVE